MRIVHRFVVSALLCVASVPLICAQAAAPKPNGMVLRKPFTLKLKTDKDHYYEERSLSVREYARLQGIPDRITFPSEAACRRSAYEMIGNSVPPLLVEHVLGQALEIGRRGSEA